MHGFFDKRRQILNKFEKKWEKTVSKKLCCKTGYSKIYLKTKKNSLEGSHCIYISVILIDSVYKKDRNYYYQVRLEKFKKYSDDSDEEYSDEKILMKKNKYINLFWEKILKFLSLRFGTSSWSIRKNLFGKNVIVFKLRAKKCHFQNNRKNFEHGKFPAKTWGSFVGSSLERSIFWNIRKTFFWEHFLILGLESYIF